MISDHIVYIYEIFIQLILLNIYTFESWIDHLFLNICMVLFSAKDFWIIQSFSEDLLLKFI